MDQATKKRLEEKFGKPCIEIIPNAALPNPTNPPPMPDLTQEQIINCLENAAVQVENYTPFVPLSEFRGKVGITVRNQPFVIEGIEFIQRFPELRPDNIDVDEWINSMQNYNIFIVIWRLAFALERLCWRAVRIFATRSFAIFRRYYVFIRAMAEGGNPIAQTIYESLRPLYANHGRRTSATSTSNDVLEEEIGDIKEISKSMLTRLKELSNVEKKLKKTLKKPVVIEKEDIKIEKEEF
jgi:hypothetical protein